MRLGIIDLGTNSVRFDIHLIRTNGSTKRLHREKLMVRLGQGVFLTSRLDSDAKIRTIAAFRSFKTTAKQFSVKRLVAFGTSALREAQDAALFVAEVQRQTGISIRILPGEEEARLIAQGIIQNESLSKGSHLLVDIGGGSTELSWIFAGQPQRCLSLNLGTARLQQVYLKTSPPSREKKSVDAVALARMGIRLSLSKPATPSRHKPIQIYASSGTAHALGKLIRKGSPCTSFNASELKTLNKMMLPLNLKELLSLPGMETKRVDMILAGGLILEEILTFFKAKKVLLTEYALRDGILEEEICRLKEHRQSSLHHHLKELELRSKKLGISHSHFKQVQKNALTLFRSLKSLHHLGQDYEAILSAAAITHDWGEAINPSGHGAHSSYLVLHSDITSMLEPLDQQWIAALCLHHQGNKKPQKDLNFLKIPAEKKAFATLLAILRVADALDRGHQENVLLQKVKVSRHEVLLQLKSGKTDDLERLRLEQKKALFEAVFNRTLTVSETFI